MYIVLIALMVSIAIQIASGFQLGLGLLSPSHWILMVAAWALLRVLLRPGEMRLKPLRGMRVIRVVGAIAAYIGLLVLTFSIPCNVVVVLFFQMFANRRWQKKKALPKEAKK